MEDIPLKILDENFSICKLDKNDSIPKWLNNSDFYSIVRTNEEMSIVSKTKNIPDGVVAEHGWKCFKVDSIMEFELVGIINSITGPLSIAEISVFVVSTYNTDYIMIKEEKIEEAKAVLEETGFIFK
jgi:hypothetical protein